MADKAQTLMQLFMEALLTLVGDDAKSEEDASKPTTREGANQSVVSLSGPNKEPIIRYTGMLPDSEPQ